MKTVFGALSLLLVLAAVGSLAARQMKTMPSQLAASGTREGNASRTGGTNEQAQQLADRVRHDVDRALENAAGAHKRDVDP